MSAIAALVTGSEVALADVAPPTVSPIVCDQPLIFVAQGTAGTHLNKEIYGQSRASFVPIGDEYAGDDASKLYNAMAWNPADSFIYAISQDNNAQPGTSVSPGNQELLRVGEGGAVQNLGPITYNPPTGPSTTLPKLFYNNGAFFNGSFYFMGNGSHTLFKLDLATMTATSTHLSQGFGASDFTQIGNYLWGVSPDPSTVWRLNPITGQVDSFAAPDIDQASAGAVWTFGNKALGISDSVSGLVTQVFIDKQDSSAPIFTIGYTEPGPASDNNDGTACLPSPPDADLAVTKSGPAQVDVNGSITWTIKVTNHGPSVSSGYVVKDAVDPLITNVTSSTPGCHVSPPSGAGAGSSLQCVGGVLKKDDSFEITLTGTAPANPACIDNRATVTGNENDPVSDNDTSNTVTTCVGGATQSNPKIEVTKSVASINGSAPSAGSKLHVGDKIIWMYDVHNNGNVALSNLRLTDAITSDGNAGTAVAIDSSSCTLGGSLAADAHTVCKSLGYTVTQKDVDAGNVADKAAATGTPPTGADVNATSTTDTPTEVVTPPADPKVTVAKTVKTVNGSALAAGQKLHVGDKIVWSYDVHNNGNVALSNLRLTDSLTSTGDPGGAVPVDTTSCTLGTSLAADAHTTCSSQPYTVTQKDVDAGNVADKATATGTSPTGDDVSATSATDTPTETVAPPARPRIDVTKTVKTINGSEPTAGQAVHLGDKIVWAYDVHNTGNVALSNLRLTDEMTSAGNPGAALPIDPGSCVLGGTLAVKAHTKCTSQPYMVTKADVDAGNVADKATATGTPPQGRDVSDTSTTITPAEVLADPKIELTKSVKTIDGSQPSSGQMLHVGDMIVWSYDVHNAGNVRLSNVQLTDAITSVGHAGASVPIDSASCTLGGSLAVDGHLICSSQPFPVTQPDVDAGNVADKATTTGTTPEPSHDVTATDTTDTPTDITAQLKLTKVADHTTLHHAGDKVTFTLVATNTGKVTLHDVSIAELKFTGTGTLSAMHCEHVLPTTLAPGDKVSCTASYVLTAADVSHHEINNTAQATGKDPNEAPVEPAQASAHVTVPREAVKPSTPDVPTKVDAGYAGKAHGPNVTLEVLGGLVIAGAVGGVTMSRRRRRSG